MSTRFLLLLIGTVACAFVGCKPKNAPDASITAKVEIADKDRPPLRVLTIEQPAALRDVLQLRWASVSEQLLEFQSLSMDELNFTKPAATDLIIAPTMLLGTFVEQDWVRDLPDDVVSRFNPEVRGEQEPVAMSGHLVRSVKYAKRTYAAPLNASLSLIGFDMGLDVKKLSGEEPPQSRLTENEFEVDWSRLRMTKPAGRTFSEVDIVDQFMAIASSKRQNAYEGSLLFKLVDCSSRVSEPWMVASAEQLRELYNATREERVQCDLGWSWATKDERQWYIPNVRRALSSREADGVEIESVRSVVDAGKGAAVYLSSTTRQSSKSIFLMKWLYEPGQLDALSSVWQAGVDADANALQAVNRNNYNVVSLQAGKSDDIPIAFQIDEGLRYRRELKQSLELIMNDAQVDILQELERCRQRMNALTEQLGRDHQQDSLERSLGLRE